jgi:16S rRNA (guanine527-N7)-methyltransferase
MHRIQPWFPNLSTDIWEHLAAWSVLLRQWNTKINLISRKDIDALEVHHLAHCLAVTKHLKLMDGARVLDVGTGGGLPGVVMAICYPQAYFVCVDSIGKKIRVVEDLILQLGLKNCEARHDRVETLTKEFDFVTGRAVTSLPDFIRWTYARVRPGKKHSLENGLLYWKGGPVEDGIEPTRQFSLYPELPESYFEGKSLLHLRQPALWAAGKTFAARASA